MITRNEKIYIDKMHGDNIQITTNNSIFPIRLVSPCKARIYIYIYIYEQETSVCMCCVAKTNKKHVCFTNLRILLIHSHVCEW